MVIFLYVRINRPRRLRNRGDRAGRAGTTSQGQVTEVSSSLAARLLCCYQPLWYMGEYKSNFECWNGTNVWWAPIFYLLYFSSYYLRFLSFQFGSSRLFFALSRHIVQIIQGRYIHSGITGF